LSRFRRGGLRPPIPRAPEAEALLRATQLCLISASRSLREIVMSAERLRADVFPPRRGKFAWAVPLLLVLAVLLVAALAFNLANLDTGGESLPQATAPGGPASRAGVFVPDPIATILLTVLSAFFLVGSVLLLLRNRSSAKRPPKAFSWSAILARRFGLARRAILDRRRPGRARLARGPSPAVPSPGPGVGGRVPDSHRASGGRRRGPSDDPRPRGGRRRPHGDPRLLRAVLRSPRVPRDHGPGRPHAPRARGARGRPVAGVPGGVGNPHVPL